MVRRGSESRVPVSGALLRNRNVCNVVNNHSSDTSVPHYHLSESKDCCMVMSVGISVVRHAGTSTLGVWSISGKLALGRVLKLDWAQDWLQDRGLQEARIVSMQPETTVETTMLMTR